MRWLVFMAVESDKVFVNLDEILSIDAFGEQVLLWFKNGKTASYHVMLKSVHVTDAPDFGGYARAIEKQKDHN